MTKEAKRTYILSILVAAIPILAGILLYNRLPEQIVTHWDAAGNPNGWSSRFTGAILYPGILFLVNLSVPALLRMDPKYENVSEKVKALIQWIIPVVEFLCSATTLMAALGIDVKVAFYAPIFLGLVFTIIGNYLPKMSQSYTIGIKLPWTLADEDNWDKTHRMAGFLWTVCGILMILGAFLPFTKTWILILAAIMVFVPTIYSYLLFRKKH